MIQQVMAGVSNHQHHICLPCVPDMSTRLSILIDNNCPLFQLHQTVGKSYGIHQRIPHCIEINRICRQVTPGRMSQLNTGRTLGEVPTEPNSSLMTISRALSSVGSMLLSFLHPVIAWSLRAFTSSFQKSYSKPASNKSLPFLMP